MNNSGTYKDDEEEVHPLPGFRFHPTDQELIGFYLRRKVEKKPLIMELIKQIDIYKYDPWDLPKSSTVGENEWYFFCRRGRKYKNSVRPNRVTSSGFWKATGIDKPVYSDDGDPRACIGLKKSLVYYRGSAGKGTKTDWMMHEFRLPPDEETNTNFPNSKGSPHQHPEAEVWTLCRIFKRSVSCRKYNNVPENRTRQHMPTARQFAPTEACSATCSEESDDRSHYNAAGYISFETPSITFHPQDQYHPDYEQKMQSMDSGGSQFFITQDQLSSPNYISSSTVNPAAASVAVSGTSFPIHNQNAMEPFTYEDWDELRSVVDQSTVLPNCSYY